MQIKYNRKLHNAILESVEKESLLECDVDS